MTEGVEIKHANKGVRFEKIKFVIVTDITEFVKPKPY